MEEEGAADDAVEVRTRAAGLGGGGETAIEVTTEWDTLLEVELGLNAREVVAVEEEVFAFTGDCKVVLLPLVCFFSLCSWKNKSGFITASNLSTCSRATWPQPLQKGHGNKTVLLSFLLSTDID